MVRKTPESFHHHFNLWVDNDGRNRKGWTWIDVDDDFEYADGHDLHRWHIAPPGLGFLIYSVHFHVLTIHITQAGDGVQMSTCNLDLNLYYPHKHGAEILSKNNRLAHTRIYYNKIGLNGLVHDADGDDTYDAATDHRNPFSVSDWRYYDPDPHYIFPHGVFVGDKLLFVVGHGSAQNMVKYSPSETVFECHIEYDMIRLEDIFKKWAGKASGYSKRQSL